MAAIPPIAREAIELARAGDHAGALVKAKHALVANGADAGLQMFAGLLHSRLLQLTEALPYFRAAAALAPDDPVARLELIRTLIALGSSDEASAMLDSGGLPTREGDKLRATLLVRQDNVAGAAAIFQRVVSSDPRDFECWNQLGACLLSLGRPDEAASAFKASLGLRPDQSGIWDKWVDSRIAARTGEEALAELETMRSLESRVAATRLLDRLDRPDEAIAVLERLSADNPGGVALIAALADMFERRNRIDDMAGAIARLQTIEPDFQGLPMLQARLAVRRKDFSGGLSHAELASPFIDPSTRLKLIGDARDRLGDHDAAWAAYSAMNEEDARANTSAAIEAEEYCTLLERECTALSDGWPGEWSDLPPAVKSPIVLLGFPRSGTTLLDTFLSAHPALCVSEEYPLLPALSEAAGPLLDLPRLTPARIEELRALYWTKAAHFVPSCADRQLVDKYPFGLVAAPYVERVFPGAKFLFVQRHPCDVVLSCYFTRFQPSGAAAAFADIAATARLYDMMMRFWSRSRALLPLTVFDVRYERMVSDTEGEMRAVAAFLNLEWVEEMTENQVAAQGRGFITTPSYAQVSEPIYDRSIERWRNYRGHLEPALPILEPWVKQLGYNL